MPAACVTSSRYAPFDSAAPDHFAPATVVIKRRPKPSSNLGLHRDGRINFLGRWRVVFRHQYITAFRDFNDLVGSNVPESLDDAGGRPANRQFVGYAMLIETKMLAQRILRSVSIAKHDFTRLLLLADVERYSCPHRIVVRVSAY